MGVNILGEGGTKETDSYKSGNSVFTLLQNQSLADLRDWLLPMLMNGQVAVENKGDI